MNEIKDNFMTSDIDHLSLPEPTAGILDRIRYLIRLSRRNQQQFSRLIGIDPSNLSKILSGRPSFGFATAPTFLFPAASMPGRFPCRRMRGTR